LGVGFFSFFITINYVLAIIFMGAVLVFYTTTPKTLQQLP
jgi:hypothetical protein